MQAVPSLVGTGTAAAAAAAGLVFAQPPVSDSSSQRPSSAAHPSRPYSSSRRVPNRKSSRSISSTSYPPSASRTPLTRPTAKSVSYASTLAPSASDDRLRNVSNGSSNTASSSSSARPHPAPSETSVAPSSTMTVPYSMSSKGDWAPTPIHEAPRDSMSSTGSWIRRLSSIRPLSHHGSVRSSVGTDTFSFNFSSSVPNAFEPASLRPPQPQRNKLVKRITSGQDANGVSLSRRGSRSHMPILRRPATSHQRSATLQQMPKPDDAGSFNSDEARPRFSFEQRSRSNLAVTRGTSTTPDGEPSSDKAQKEKRWTSFFHSRVFKSSPSLRAAPFSIENSPSTADGTSSPLPGKTIQTQGSNQAGPFLTHASALSKPERVISVPLSHDALVAVSAASPVSEPALTSSLQPAIVIKAESSSNRDSASASGSNASPSDAQSKNRRRSFSRNFSSPTSWIARTGSLRRPKRGDAANTNTNNPNYSTPPPASGRPRSGGNWMAQPLSATSTPPIATASTGKRHVSAPSTSPLYTPRPPTAPAHYQFQARSGTTHDLQLDEPTSERGLGLPTSYFDQKPAVSTRQRNASSPLPRLSSFHVDRVGSHRTVSGSGPPGFAGMPRAFPLISRNRAMSDMRSSTLSSSDHDYRAFSSSIDDDDTDFKSDTVFDSVRTTATTSTRMRSTDTTIEFMFDDSPPSTAGNGNGKTKRLSIQEILGRAPGSDTRIMEEEDEGPTPMRAAAALSNRSLSPSTVLHGFDFSNAGYRRPDLGIAVDAHADAHTSQTDGPDYNYSRPSMDDSFDDDFDDDWARVDDSGVVNSLSPPSLSLQNSLRGTNGFVFSSDSNENQDQRRSLQPPPRSPLSVISGNGTAAEQDDFYDAMSSFGHERPRSTLFDWSESTSHLDKADADGHSARPKTVHGKQEIDMRNGRPPNRKGPVVAHVRSQSVPVNVDPAESTKSSTCKFGTWASGAKNASEDWDDDFDFGTSCSGDAVAEDVSEFGSEDGDPFGQSTTLRHSKGPASAFKMVVPASIQATQPTVKAHSGQIRELSLLVNGLKRLWRHARDLDIVDEAPELWKEAENIISLASPDEDIAEAAATKGQTTTIEEDNEVPRTSFDFDIAEDDQEKNADSDDDCFTSANFDVRNSNNFDEDPFTAGPATPPRFDMSKTGVVRERHASRRRSVFSPDDDIFGGGGWPLASDFSPAKSSSKSPAKSLARSPAKSSSKSPAKSPTKSPARLELLSKGLDRPETPEGFTPTTDTPDSAMIESIMQAMQQQRSASAPIRKSPVRQSSSTELFFNTNTLQELVKRANTVFHTLSDLVRRAELFTQSPAVTPRHNRLNRCEDGSPAFTRVFTDPSSPSKKLPMSLSNNSVAARSSPGVESPPANRVSQRLQMMIVS